MSLGLMFSVRLSTADPAFLLWPRCASWLGHFRTDKGACLEQGLCIPEPLWCLLWVQVPEGPVEGAGREN